MRRPKNRATPAKPPCFGPLSWLFPSRNSKSSYTSNLDNAQAEKQGDTSGANSMLQNLGELWDDAEYDELNSLEGFVKTLGS